MQIIDITRPIHPDMAVYPNNPEVVFERVSEATEQTSAVTKISLGTHTGTHIDAPAHIDPQGAGTYAYPLEQLNGPAEVIDCTAADRVILAADLPATSAERVLIKTKNSEMDIDTFDDSFIALAETAAQDLVERGVRVVGIDALSIKKKGVKDRVHALFLDAGIVIIEGLWLRDIPARVYELLCLPLATDLDGAPVRAVLRG